MAVVILVAALILVNVSIVIVVPSMAVVVEVASLEVDGSQALLESGCALTDPHLSQGLDHWNKHVGIKCSIVLLGQAEGSALPVRHLLSLA